MDYRFPLGAQLVPVLVSEPHLPNDAIWCLQAIPGIWYCGPGVWKRRGKRAWTLYNV